MTVYNGAMSVHNAIGITATVASDLEAYAGLPALVFVKFITTDAPDGEGEVNVFFQSEGAARAFAAAISQMTFLPATAPAEVQEEMF